MKDLTIIIPNRPNENPKETIKSIDIDCEIVSIKDRWKNANKCRNEGFKLCNTEFVLFSDNDVSWENGAIAEMLNVLKNNVSISYTYGYYYLLNGEEKRAIGKQPFDMRILLQRNYINTMSMIRAKDFVGFDEKIERFQDWDLWLTLAGIGMFGHFINRCVFTTKAREGITPTSQNRNELLNQINIIKQKHHALYSDTWL